MFLTHKQAQLYTVSFGVPTAPTIVGIGGWIGSWELWAEPFALLSKAWHTIAYDHRGSGATTAPVATITAEQLVDDLFAVLDAYHVTQCVVAAESAGAVTALSAALEQPDRITGLVIVDGMYFRPPMANGDMFLMGLQNAYEATLDRFVDACVPGTENAHIKRWGRQIIDHASQEAALALYQATGKVDLRHRLSQITQPTLIMHGEADAIVPVAAAQMLAQALPNATLVTLPGAGHVPTLTHAVEIVKEISRLL